VCIDDGGRSSPLYRFAWNKGSRVSRVLEEEEKCEKVNDVDVEINVWRPERRGRTDGRTNGHYGRTFLEWIHMMKVDKK